MKASELMIGDWVYDKLLKGYGKIEVLTPFAIQCDIHTDTHHMDFFEPIPLTEEILKANGFEEKFDGWFDVYEYTNQGMRLVKHEEGFSFCIGYKVVFIHYVHELQRALRCCELFDLANNFKLRKDEQVY